MLLRRLNYPRTTGLILRRTYPELYKSHIVKMFEEYPEIRPWWRQESKELVFPNGSRLFFGSAEHESDMGGFYSAEFADIMVDEAQEFSQMELERLSGSNRCTSNPNITPAMLYTFMPGLSETGLPPKGLNYLKRVLVDNTQRGEETRLRWAFVQAFAWDNIEWARKELEIDGVSEGEFYGWSEDHRRDYFIERTEFGAVLASLTNDFLRDAWLHGKWGVFQGQYFSNFDYDRHTVDHSLIDIKRWHKRWISGDWGFEHPLCMLWHVEDEQGHITTYRELWARNMGETQLGEEIGRLSYWPDASGKPVPEKLKCFWLSWDAFGKLNKTTRKSITEMIGESLPSNVPKPTPADASPGSRISGWRLMHQMLDSDTWTISRDCPKLIECIPLLVRDMERNSEDVLKVDWSTECLGDDPADAARYGLQNMVNQPSVPFEEELREKTSQIGDPTARAIYTQRLIARRTELEKQDGMGPAHRVGRMRWERQH